MSKNSQGTIGVSMQPKSSCGTLLLEFLFYRKNSFSALILNFQREIYV